MAAAVIHPVSLPVSGKRGGTVGGTVGGMVVPVSHGCNLQIVVTPSPEHGSTGPHGSSVL